MPALDSLLESVRLPLPASAPVIVAAATVDFPNAITFNGRFSSDSEIQDAWLEYGTTELTCGSVIAKVKPDFTPGKEVKVEWAWEMRQSGALPPGATDIRLEFAR